MSLFIENVAVSSNAWFHLEYDSNVIEPQLNHFQFNNRTARGKSSIFVLILREHIGPGISHDFNEAIDTTRSFIVGPRYRLEWDSPRINLREFPLSEDTILFVFERGVSE